MSILGQISILSQIGPSVPKLAGQGYQIVELTQRRQKSRDRQYLLSSRPKILGLAKNSMFLSPKPVLSPRKLGLPKSLKFGFLSQFEEKAYEEKKKEKKSDESE